jgi:thiol:disulfide interchange protein
MKKFYAPLMACFACVGLVYGIVSAQDLSSDITLDKSSYSPGDTVIAVLHVVIPEKFHLYGNPLGPGIGKPAKLRVYSHGGIRWIGGFKTRPKRFYPEIGEWVWAYEKEAWFFLKGVLDAKAPTTIEGTVFFDGLVCATSCLPVSIEKDFTVEVGNAAPGPSFGSAPNLRVLFGQAENMDFQALSSKQPPAQAAPSSGQLTFAIPPPSPREAPPAWDYEPIENKVSLNLLLALLFGFIAGLILNVMPCVLPVIGIKILSLANAGGASRKAALLRSLAFAGGMMLVFMALATLASFAHLSWGQQFQSPWFLLALIVLTVVFALGLFDVYVLVVPNSISTLSRKSDSGYAGEFLRGMFATLLATPCSGPFLGATLAWTLTQPTPVIFLVFASIGTGMAFPYVVLSASRTLARLVPRPGKWMEDFKNLMGVLLLAAAVYFLMGLPKDMVVSAVGLSVAVAFSVVFFFRFAPFGSSWKRYAVSACVATALAAAGFYLSFGVIYRNTSSQAAMKADERIQWEDFSPKTLLDAHAGGRHVMVDFTADWCLNCQYNLITVFSSKEVADLVVKKNVLALKADITTSNPAAESLLHALGSRSVPFFAVFPGDDPYHPIIMRDILGKGAVAKVLKKLRER